ncbi:MAG TPA: prolyl oligopeptidase family serine peptidase [Terriglobia bacterium]|nr:prolyl oligopeptidase family serine peptidase [Terriglobia bacterium]
MLNQSSFSSDLNRRIRTSPELATIVLTAWSMVLCASMGRAQGPPATRKDDFKETLHGVEIADPYRWLEDQQSPETRSWIDAQNKYTQSLLKTWPGRESLQRRLSALMRIETIEAPVERGGRYFFRKRPASQDQAILFMRKGLEGKDEVLIDPNPLSPDHSTSVNLIDVSHDGAVIAYGFRHGGEDEVSIQLLNVDTHQALPDHFPRARYSGFSMTPDKSTAYYSRLEANGPRVYVHAMGEDPVTDKQIFGEGLGLDKIIGVDLSEDGHYLIIHVLHGAAADQTEIYYQDLAAQGPLKPLVNDIAARFFGSVGGNQLFLHTNWKAPNGRILVVDLKNPARDHWREVIPESKSAIESMSLAGGKLLVDYMENASSHVRVFDTEGRFLRDLDLPTIGSVEGVSSRWSSPEAFYGFSSFVVPYTIYRYDVAAGNQSVWARLNVPIQSEKFEVKQFWYESKDKTRVPMFLLYRKGIKLDGSNPTLLTGYGGFNLNETPYFSDLAAVWVEQGGVFAVPNLRGGGEFGEAWHKAGMFEKKQNVFDDFIAAAEWLIKNGYTNSSRLAIMGTSNGGLLVGAALTQRPDLFRAVYCGYPLLDMLRYQKFLVARYWVAEYGSSDDPVQFKYLYAYSPYHHVRQGTKYPAVLLASGDSDTRVAPLHARKMTALLQAATGSGHPVLLRYDTEAGHSRGGMSITKRIEQATDEVGFLFWQLGVTFNSTK